MKCRLFSVSLSVNMAMPPMPEFSSSDVRVELNVSVRNTYPHYHIVSETLTRFLHRYIPETQLDIYSD